MKIEVPTEEEYREEKKRKRRHLIGGLLFGLFLFGLIGLRIFLRYGIDQVAYYIWVALGLGVILLGFLAYKFDSLFWSIFKR